MVCVVGRTVPGWKECCVQAKDRCGVGGEVGREIGFTGVRDVYGCAVRTWLSCREVGWNVEESWWKDAVAGASKVKGKCCVAVSRVRCGGAAGTCASRACAGRGVVHRPRHVSQPWW